MNTKREMMAYRVETIENTTVITEYDLRVEIRERAGADLGHTAHCLATLYHIKGGFVPYKVFVFQTEGADLEALKKIVDFFFTTLLETELYVKEVPQGSTMFTQEAARVYGANEVEINHKTISNICDIQAV